MKSLAAIAEEINTTAEHYQMGQFPELRRQIHGLTRVKDHRIFTAQTIHKNWAFHLGGRRELQFNIGFERKNRCWFRYGVAFSLEASQTLPKPLVLKDKILKLNDYLNKNAAHFEDLRFWYYSPDRSPTLPIQRVPANAITVGGFLFWGHLCPRSEVDVSKVLFLFDRLLPIYRHVEGRGPASRPKPDLRKGLVFKAGCPPRREASVAHSREQVRSTNLRHNAIQVALHKALSTIHGANRVGAENDTGRGSRIDLVVRDGSRHDYYEIKPYPCVRTCIREAVGQLLEYSYWPGGNTAHRMVIVSENPLTADAKRYLARLRRRFSMPIYYRRIEVAKATLHPLE